MRYVWSFCKEKYWKVFLPFLLQQKYEKLMRGMRRMKVKTRWSYWESLRTEVKSKKLVKGGCVWYWVLTLLLLVRRTMDVDRAARLSSWSCQSKSILSKVLNLQRVLLGAPSIIKKWQNYPCLVLSWSGTK